jgi:hypothetical protein
MRTWSSLLITLWSMPSYMSERELFVMNLWGWVTASWDSVDGNRMTCVKLLWGRSESPFTMREDGHLTRKGQESPSPRGATVQYTEASQATNLRRLCRRPAGRPSLMIFFFFGLP